MPLKQVQQAFLQPTILLQASSRDLLRRIQRKQQDILRNRNAIDAVNRTPALLDRHAVLACNTVSFAQPTTPLSNSLKKTLIQSTDALFVFGSLNS